MAISEARYQTAHLDVGVIIHDNYDAIAILGEDVVVYIHEVDVLETFIKMLDTGEVNLEEKYLYVPGSMGVVGSYLRIYDATFDKIREIRAVLAIILDDWRIYNEENQ